MTWRIEHGDCLDRLREMPDESVQCVVTSPPYWGLRDYGVDGQVGLEDSLDEHIDKLVAVFREVRRVLRSDGTLWCNYGDGYHSNVKSGFNGQARQDAANLMSSSRVPRPEGVKPKDLLGMPWMLAFALRADGWFLRSDIIWHKPNPMPESVTDRPTKAHEYVFLLTKSARYFYDAQAIREEATGLASGNVRPDQAFAADPQRHRTRANLASIQASATRNARTVWAISTQPMPEAHFATFPEALAERCIEAGTSNQGACGKCGAPRRRKIAKQVHLQKGDQGRAHIGSMGQGWEGAPRATTATATVGWEPTCDCEPAQHAPCVVLDPFAGAGTTLLVAERLGRDSIGIELNEEYIAIAERRINAADPMAAAPVGETHTQRSLWNHAGTDAGTEPEGDFKKGSSSNAPSGPFPQASEIME